MLCPAAVDHVCFLTGAPLLFSAAPAQLRTQLHRHGRSTSFRSGPPRTASSSSARARVPADDAAAAAAATILPPSDDADGPGLPNGSGTATADLTASNNDNEATPLLRSIYRNTAGGADGHANGSGAAGDRPWYSAAAAGAAHATRKTLASSWANVLLVFVPIGIAAGAAGWSAPAIFAINFVAIMPLAALLSFATEELATRLGETLGGLLNATFGNAVELIVRRPFCFVSWSVHGLRQRTRQRIVISCCTK